MRLQPDQQQRASGGRDRCPAVCVQTNGRAQNLRCTRTPVCRMPELRSSEIRFRVVDMTLITSIIVTLRVSITPLLAGSRKLVSNGGD